MNMHNGVAAQQSQARAEVTNAFLRSVYNWMAIGLGVTAVVAWLTMENIGVIYNAVGKSLPTLFIVAMVVELGMVFFLSARINKLAASTATGLFIAYSALSGFTLSGLLLVYTGSSVLQAFLTTAGMFAAVSLYGLTTKRDLAGVGSFCMMGLFGLIIASVVNLFMHSSMLEFGISCIGVLVFVGLTAYDTQYLKEMGQSMPEGDATVVRRGVIMGALKLYLDFINLFIMLLRLIGDRR
jgi:FtsH-binding integral membrane protein